MTTNLALFRIVPGTLPGVAAPAATGPNTLTGLVVPYGTALRRFGTTLQFGPGSLRLPDDLSTVKLLVEHDPDRPVGYATAAQESDAGLTMTFTLGDHPRAAELADEAAQLLRDGFSVGVEIDDTTEAEITRRLWDADDTADPITVTGALREVSAVAVPAFNNARQHRQAATVATFTALPKGSPTVPDTLAADPPAPTPTVQRLDAAAAPSLPASMTVAELTAAVRAELGAAPAAPQHPLAAFSTFADYAAAVRDNPALQLALVDQITPDNPGLVRPGWLTEVIGAIEQASPVTAALSVGGLPAGGMSFDWPTYTGDYKSLVQKQLTEKSEIHSAKVSFGKSSAVPIETFAGGSDISYQLLRRSSPSYLAEYNKIMAMAYGWCVEDTMSDYLTAAAGASVVCPPLTATAQQVRAALFSASNKVRLATGRPASDVLVSSDVFEKWGALDGLENPAYGTQNTPGTSSAATLTINVNGLAITEGPALVGGTVLVTNTDAAAIYRDGPFTVTADDVAKLGQNVAIWGMAAFAPKRPTGIVTFTATGGAASSSSTKK